MTSADAIRKEDSEPLGGLGQRVVRIARDGRLGGDELAVAVAIATLLETEGPEKLSVGNIHRAAFPQGSVVRRERDGMREYEWRHSTAAHVLDRDARTYQPRSLAGAQKCQAPKQRKDAPCGKRSAKRSMHTDWATGERFWIEACAGHLEWYEQRLHEHKAAEPQVGKAPEPYANKGGRIAKHFPEIDWPHLWRALTPHWKQYPERESSRIPTEWGDLRIRIDEPPERLQSENVVSFSRKQEPEEKPDRYRFQGRLNRTQVELLKMAATDSLKAWRTTFSDLAGSVTTERWGPTEVPVTRGDLWIPGLVEAGLLRVVPLPRFGGGRYGLYRLTGDGKKWLDAYEQGAKRPQEEQR